MPGASEPRAHGSSTLQKEIRDTRKRKASSGSEKAEGNQQSQKAKDLPVEKAEGKKESCTEKMKDKDKDVSIMIEEDQERTKTQKEKEVPKLRKHGEQDEPKKEEDAQKLKNKQKSKSEKGEPKQAQHDNKQKKRKADTEPTEEKNELQKVKPKNERGKEDRKPTKAKKDEMDEERNRAEEKNDEVQQVEDGKDMKKVHERKKPSDHQKEESTQHPPGPPPGPPPAVVQPLPGPPTSLPPKDWVGASTGKGMKEGGKGKRKDDGELFSMRVGKDLQGKDGKGTLDFQHVEQMQRLLQGSMEIACVTAKEFRAEAEARREVQVEERRAAEAEHRRRVEEQAQKKAMEEAQKQAEEVARMRAEEAEALRQTAENEVMAEILPLAKRKKAELEAEAEAKKKRLKEEQEAEAAERAAARAKGKGKKGIVVAPPRRSESSLRNLMRRDEENVKNLKQEQMHLKAENYALLAVAVAKHRQVKDPGHLPRRSLFRHTVNPGRYSAFLGLMYQCHTYGHKLLECLYVYKTIVQPDRSRKN